MHAADSQGVEVRRVFRAPCARVFDVWTRPEFIKRWNSRSGLSVPVAEVDLRVGGKYRMQLHAPDGTVHRIIDSYRVVEPPRRLSYTWLAESGARHTESLVTVEFLEHADGTEVRLRHEQLPTPESRRRHAGGWAACLAQLATIIHEDELLDDSTIA